MSIVIELSKRNMLCNLNCRSYHFIGGWSYDKKTQIKNTQARRMKIRDDFAGFLFIYHDTHFMFEAQLVRVRELIICSRFLLIYRLRPINLNFEIWVLYVHTYIHKKKNHVLLKKTTLKGFSNEKKRWNVSLAFWLLFQIRDEVLRFLIHTAASPR